MPTASCHASTDEPVAGHREGLRALLLKKLTVKRVAGWCDVSEAAIYQWISRGTPEEPIPPSHVPAIIKGAKADGLPPFDIGIIWPAMASAELSR